MHLITPPLPPADADGDGMLDKWGTDLNQWYNLRATRVGTTMSFYIDGILIGSTQNFTSTGVLGDTVSIGAFRKQLGDFEGRFQGQIDNVMIIPETTTLLLGLAGFGLALRRRR